MLSKYYSVAVSTYRRKRRQKGITFIQAQGFVAMRNLGSMKRLPGESLCDVNSLRSLRNTGLGQ
jgi:hypothetical protein